MSLHESLRQSIPPKVEDGGVVIVPVLESAAEIKARIAANKVMTPPPVKVKMREMPAEIKAQVKGLLERSPDYFMEKAVHNNSSLEIRTQEWAHDDELKIERDGTYKGTWLQNLKHGFGVYKWADGRQYIGEWSRNRMSGVGIYTWPSSRKEKKSQSSTLSKSKTRSSSKAVNSYQGQWENDRMHGWGRYEWSDGRYYEGQWDSGCMSGHGTYKWPNGRFIKGNFLNDVLHGKGLLFDSDGSFYYGDWESGRKSGYGKIIWEDGFSSYSGQWQDDIPHGHGLAEWYEWSERPLPDVTIYEGEWLLGRKHGEGKHTWPDGIICHGVWDTDEIVSGKYTYPDGNHYF
eukprot:TRINITY_DN8058_c0_g2_i1.p1 TRINITY_DN8058_c0_g2~~TRINITY_DN8058_c0_g2_i1.p1  ORF type:complete len:345 (+),score=57.84 TRINITY_DN8058_c0_g2_i1:49-1083(+)